jgi:hypothetical protein
MDAHSVSIPAQSRAEWKYFVGYVVDTNGR